MKQKTRCKENNSKKKPDYFKASDALIGTAIGLEAIKLIANNK